MFLKPYSLKNRAQGCYAKVVKISRQTGPNYFLYFLK